MLPGVLYDMDHQCRLQYGAASVFCKDMDVSVGRRGGDGAHQPAAPREKPQVGRPRAPG